jgi:diguanylate cyclase (GGDEF)-like protein/PAS domain S-box-containing protein
MSRLTLRLSALDLARLLLVALGTGFAAWLGSQLEVGHQAGPAVWPEVGVAVAAVVLAGRRMLPAVALGGLLSGLVKGDASAVTIATAASSTATAWLACELLRRTGFRETLRRTSDVTAFVGLAALLSTALGAWLGVIGLVITGHVAASAAAAAWRAWWLGGCAGVLIVGSTLLVLGTVPLAALRSQAAVRVLAASAGAGLASYLLLDAHGSVPYLSLPLLFVLAIVYRQRGVAIGGFAISVAALILTARGHGPFPGGSAAVQLIRTQTFLCVGSVTSLLVAASQSEREVAERAVDRLAESESALAEAQRLAHIGSFDVDLVTGRTIWSRELYRILGRRPGELDPGCPSWIGSVHPDDREALEETADRANHECGSFGVVHRIVRPDGQVRVVDVRFRSEDGGHGAPVRIVGTVQDVTVVLLAERRFRSLFEDAAYPIVVIDAVGRVALSNARAQLMFGYDAAELTGRAVAELVPVPAGGGRPWWESVGRDGLHPDVELWARRRDGSEFPVEVSVTPLETEEGVLVSVAIRDVTMLRRAAEALVHEARHDPLTGLANRLMFLERLDRALARSRRSGRALGVVFIDLDDFKEVNDTRGHDAGDLLLTSLTQRLNETVRDGDTLARLGGDEFVVLCEDLEDEAEAIAIAHRFADAVLEPVTIGGYEHSISISAGVVMVSDARGATADGVLHDADAAMYAAKASGKGRVAVFDKRMRERLSERSALESALRGALLRRELKLHFQPTIGLDHGRVTGAEALLRWEHPVRGMLTPAEFLGVAESTGLIGEIGEWVIGEACRQAVAWRDQHGAAGPVPVSVNVSAHELTRSDLAATVRRALEETGLPPSLLEIEVTESTLLLDVGATRRELGRLKQLGVKLVVDDFGTGYSSLPGLRRLAVDRLKLDRSIVQTVASEDDGGAFVTAVVGIAGAIDAVVIAEGVETREQADRMRDFGCDQAQGYAFARPVPADEFTELLEREFGRFAAV